MKIFWSFFLCLFGFTLYGQVPTAPQNYVTDVAGLLSAEEEQTLNQMLAAYEDSTTNQIFVLLTRSLEGRIIEEISLETATQWGVGQKGEDNGLLISIFADDRQMRFEVGYGLEPFLTDYQTQRIQQDDMIPFIKEGDYFHAIETGINRSILIIETPPQEPTEFEKLQSTFYEIELYPPWPPLRWENGYLWVHWAVLLAVILLGMYPVYLLFGLIAKMIGAELKTPWKRGVLLLTLNTFVFLSVLWLVDDTGFIFVFPRFGPVKILWAVYALCFFWMPVLGIWLKMSKDIHGDKKSGKSSTEKKRKAFTDFSIFEKVMYYIAYTLYGGMIWTNLVLFSIWGSNSWGVNGIFTFIIVNLFMSPFVFSLSLAFLGEGGSGGSSGSGGSWSSSSGSSWSSSSSFSGGGGGSFGGGGSSSSW